MPISDSPRERGGSRSYGGLNADVEGTSHHSRKVRSNGDTSDSVYVPVKKADESDALLSDVSGASGSSVGKQQRLPTRVEKAIFWGGRVSIDGAFGAELFYAVFSAIDGALGLQILLKNVFHIEIPDAAALITAGILAGLDYQANITVMRPASDAREAAGIQEEFERDDAGEVKKNEHGDPIKTGKVYVEYGFDSNIPKEEQTKKNAFTFFAFKVLPTLVAQANFFNGSVTDAIAVKALMDYFVGKGDMSEDNARIMTIALSGLFTYLGMAYYNFLSFTDVANAVSDLRDFKNSPIKHLFQNNKWMFSMAVSKSLVTHTSRGSTFYLISKQFLQQVFPWLSNTKGFDDTTINALSYFFGACGFTVSALTRTLPAFRLYLDPFDQQTFYNFEGKLKGRPLYTVSNTLGTGQIQQGLSKASGSELTIGGKSLAELSGSHQLSGVQKLLIALPGLMLGTIRAGSIGYVMYHYMEECLQQYLPGPWSEIVSAVIAAVAASPLLAHAAYTDYQFGKNVYFKNKEKQLAQSQKAEASDGKSVGWGLKLYSLGVNVGSQAVRTFITVKAGQELWEGVVDLPVIAALYFGIGAEVGFSNGIYFQEKMEKGVPQQMKDVRELGGNIKSGVRKSGALLANSILSCKGKKGDYDSLAAGSVGSKVTSTSASRLRQEELQADATTGTSPSWARTPGHSNADL